MNVIETSGLTKDFRQNFRGNVRALDGFDLTVREGEVFGLLGPNGAGKTTLVKILLGLTFPTRGKAAMFGSDVRDCRTRDKVGYLPEGHRLPTYLSGREAMELFGKLSGLESEKLDKQIPALLKMVKMDEWARMKTKKYSKGMAQRLGLAQALLGNPKLIFLDEPTDGVDPIGRQEIRSVLLEMKKQGTTIFINSHLLSEIEMICDRVAILDNGRLVAQGRLDELTNDTNRYRIKCSGIGPELDCTLESLTLAKTVENDWLDIKVESLEQLNRVIDSLRTAGTLIESVVPSKKSLESYFIELIEDIRGGGKRK